MLPTGPAGPPLSATRRAFCWPAWRVTVCPTLCQFCHDPVSGIVIAPETFTPFISRWNVPPCPSDATRKVTAYEPAALTLTVYFSHSPATSQPTSLPPSALGSRSTSVDRYAPPL